MIQSNLNSIKIGGSDWCRMVGHHWQKIGGVVCCTNCWEEAPHGKKKEIGEDTELVQVSDETRQSSSEI